jgi:hypothetical protein
MLPLAAHASAKLASAVPLGFDRESFSRAKAIDPSWVDSECGINRLQTRIDPAWVNWSGWACFLYPG